MVALDLKKIIGIDSTMCSTINAWSCTCSSDTPTTPVIQSSLFFTDTKWMCYEKGTATLGS